METGGRDAARTGRQGCLPHRARARAAAGFLEHGIRACRRVQDTEMRRRPPGAEGGACAGLGAGILQRASRGAREDADVSLPNALLIVSGS